MYGQKINRWVVCVSDFELGFYLEDFTVGKEYQLCYNDSWVGLKNLELTVGVKSNDGYGWINLNTYRNAFKEITFDKYLTQAEQCK